MFQLEETNQYNNSTKGTRFLIVVQNKIFVTMPQLLTYIQGKYSHIIIQGLPFLYIKKDILSKYGTQFFSALHLVQSLTPVQSKKHSQCFISISRPLCTGLSHYTQKKDNKELVEGPVADKESNQRTYFKKKENRVQLLPL